MRKNGYQKKHQNGFTIIEVVVVFLLILGITFFVLPKNMETTQQAKLISKWNEKYTQLQYMASVIVAQKNGEITRKFNKAQDSIGKQQIILEAIKPYLRITSKLNEPYSQNYLNKVLLDNAGTYFVKDFYLTNTGEVIGLKVINPNCKEKEEVCAIITIDLNGIKPPNTWGYDIYGVNVLGNNLEPIGKGIDQEILKENCSKYGSGVYCSYYYLIGGKFD